MTDLDAYIRALHSSRVDALLNQEKQELQLKRAFFDVLGDHYMDAARRKRGLFEFDAATKIARTGKTVAINPIANVLKEEIDSSLMERQGSLNNQQAVWSFIAKDVVPIVHRHRINLQQDKITASHQFAEAAASVLKRSTNSLQSNLGSTSSKCRKASREMLHFWRKHEKEERELRKKAEKEEMERLKQEEDEREKQRQAKKLQFLLTQTELYSHFVGNKLSLEPAAQNFNTVNESNIELLSDQDIEKLARAKAQAAVKQQLDKTKSFDTIRTTTSSFRHAETVFNETISQPKMLTCQLKPYQLKGVNWLANLYEQGINGILADDMGLGKTVQSISLLAHLAETYGVWGPFLVVTPASTLHNWQQEFTKFTPVLRSVPYWGNAKERTILRKYWSGNRIYGKDSPFHVVITSYQIAVTDQSYFQRIKWQYMILDEAHAIKSSSSARWKTLLAFNCRNRLLLTGTPIQNTMAELWALLHFIMPTIFDSHEEFADWFSRDIETHAADKEKGKLNQRQLQKLHSILKPFMLRRVKSDVEHELGEKIEKTIYCDLTPRQKRMYNALDSSKIVHNFEKGELDEDFMNAIMQFRKVCNHPQIFEAAETTSPYVFGREMGGFFDDIVPYRLRNAIEYKMPRLVWEELVLSNSKTKSMILDVSTNKSPIAVDITELKDNVGSASVLQELCNITRSKSAIYQTLQDVPIFFHEKMVAPPIDLSCSSQSFAVGQNNLMKANAISSCYWSENLRVTAYPERRGFSRIEVPNPRQLLFESGKLQRLDELLFHLKAEGHRVLIYFQMTKMIDLIEEYLNFRKFSYLRLDGSTKISDRRDLVSDWQTRPDIFVFVLSTRAGGLGINLTAADTVIFYDSDWNPTGNLF